MVVYIIVSMMHDHKNTKNENNILGIKSEYNWTVRHIEKKLKDDFNTRRYEYHADIRYIMLTSAITC